MHPQLHNVFGSCTLSRHTTSERYTVQTRPRNDFVLVKEDCAITLSCSHDAYRRLLHLHIAP